MRWNASVSPASFPAHSAPPPLATAGIRRALIVVVALLAALTAAGLAVEWPGAVHARYNAQLGSAPQLSDATVVTAAGAASCRQHSCESVRVRLDDGRVVPLQNANNVPGVTLQPGDHVVVAHDNNDAGGYYFSDFQRGRPLMLLAIVFAVVVVAIARWRGFAAIAGLGVTWIVLVKFLLPGLLDGENPVLVAVIGASCIMLVVLYLAHGVSIRTTTALLGTVTSLALTAGLAAVFTALTHVSGASSDEATYLQTIVGRVDLRGVVLAGVVIGSLGVLNDVTVTQASAVWEIAAASPARTVRRLYVSGMRVGRDHIASTVYTLVLAYAGASLPLLLLFNASGQPVGRVLTGDAVTEEILRTLIGAIGLVAAVPITTALAAALAARASHGEPEPYPTSAAPKSAVQSGAT